MSGRKTFAAAVTELVLLVGGLIVAYVLVRELTGIDALEVLR